MVQRYAASILRAKQFDVADPLVSRAKRRLSDLTLVLGNPALRTYLSAALGSPEAREWLSAYSEPFVYQDDMFK